MKNLLFTIIFCLGVMIIQAQIWQEHKLNYDAPLFGADISTVSKDVVWLGAWTGVFNTAQWDWDFQNHHFALSTDGGITWKTDTFPFSGMGYLSNIHGVSSSTAWIAYNDFGVGPVLYTTNDGGQNWENKNPGIDTWINFVHFFNEMNGVIMGDPDDDGFMLYFTTDGGASWSRVEKDKMPEPIDPDEWGQANLYNTDGRKIWTFTYYDRLLISEDMGESWKAIELPFQSTDYSYPVELAFQDSIGVLVVGHYGVDSDSVTIDHVHKHSLYRTTNYGEDWLLLTEDPVDFATEKIQYLSGTKTLIGVFRRNNNDGPFETRVSYDHGSTWKTIDVGSRIFRVDFVDNSTGFGSEYKNDTNGPTVFRYIGDPLTGILENKRLLTELNIYPNPVIHSFQYKMELNSVSESVLLINDLKGNLVK
jgi:photosystem II stability/assembly factor-like uncharacterized protein